MLFFSTFLIFIGTFSENRKSNVVLSNSWHLQLYSFSQVWRFPALLLRFGQACINTVMSSWCFHVQLFRQGPANIVLAYCTRCTLYS